MAPAARDARIARMRAEEDALVQTDARWEELQRDELDTKSTLAAVQAKLDAITAEMRTVRARQRTLRSSLDSMRLQHQRELWTNVIPLEVLQLVFEECTISSTEIVTEFGQERGAYDEAAAPFAIATTCSRWRKIALVTPRLWTYMVLAPKSDGQVDFDALRERADAILVRSKNLSLDVLLSFSSLQPDRTDVWTLIVAITTQAVRMRSFELWLPSGLLRAEAGAFDPFKAPTPALERLCMVGDVSLEPEDPPDDGSDWGAYFMHAPKLIWIEFQLARMSCPPGHRFEALQTLMLWRTYPDVHTQRMVAAASFTLQRLVVSGDWGLVAIQQPLSLPVLTVLGVYEILPMLHHCIVAPRVHSIELSASVVVPEMAPFLDHFADRIKTLTLRRSEISPDCLGILQTLRNVETLICQNGDDTPHWDAIFGELAESPTIWPNLRSIRILKQTGTKLRDGFLNLVRARSTVASEDTDNGSQPAKLVEVDIADSGAPAWLRASVQHLLQKSSQE
ncbi:hypothetical protein EXIGLDRAFT_833324 [Exidia glandulosa HHB12029]|uniref:F-box domain-containing protein n=1 Tax=Exidia glandulosa HHB12029 TaxID=1314781 RepID=A0A165KU97_EXIGL|nr:hypothetical protein EXIGLDRAFT_833324 [Exidia glandulosa HHB12029]